MELVNAEIEYCQFQVQLESEGQPALIGVLLDEQPEGQMHAEDEEDHGEETHEDNPWSSIATNFFPLVYANLALIFVHISSS